MMMVNSGNVDLQKVYTDGTKIEAKSNRYTFVWGNSIKANKERIAKQLEELWQYTQEVAAEELKDTTPTKFNSVEPQEVRNTIEQIDQALKDKPVPAKVKQKIKYAKKNWPDKLEEYKKKEEQLGDRNSYSKTDTDATFMRMKEDHMRNGQLKPAYNVQISTNEQIIVNFSLHQNPTDTKTLKPHLELFEKQYGFMPHEITTDAGYGSEENYEFLDQNHVDASVKYNYFDKEQHDGGLFKGIFHVDNLLYDKANNCYYCPMGQKMTYIGIKAETTEAGYPKTLSRYQAQNCSGCTIRTKCHKGKNNRIIEVSLRFIELRAKAKERLQSERGKFHRSKRPIDVEPVFGMIKQNMGFRRFLLKGLDKVSIEFGLLAMAHNIKKIA